MRVLPYLQIGPSFAIVSEVLLWLGAEGWRPEHKDRGVGLCRPVVASGVLADPAGENELCVKAAQTWRHLKPPIAGGDSGSWTKD